MTIKNVQRDGVFVDLSNTAKVAWSTGNANTVTDFLMNGPTGVQGTFCQVSSQSHVNTSISGQNKKAIGCYIDQPVDDRVPYRVKAYAAGPDSGVSFMIGVGYAPASITGSDDIISEPLYLPFDTHFDELIIVEEEEDGDTYFGRPLCFAVVAQANNAGIGDFLRAHISVQRLAVSPPTMQNAVS